MLEVRWLLEIRRLLEIRVECEVRRLNVLLFDLDGTLVDTGGAGRRALDKAFSELCGTAEFLNFSLAGMTDRAIVRAGLRHAGQLQTDPAAAEAQIDQLIARYLAHLEGEVQNSRGYRIYPGVEALLERLEQLTESHAVGLGTGNVLEGARIKLARGGLADRFRFGGFGSDSENRAILLQLGAERGAHQLGQPRANCRIVVIGDTPLDIEAAQAMGAECLAVATGPYSVDELRQAGASTVVSQLDQPQAQRLLLET